MSNINLPERFEQKLKANQQLNGIVNSTLSKFGEILGDNKLYFFEEYTDHGISHIESVIRSSNHLITTRTFQEVFTEKDVAFYILAVVLHDIGMHIRPEGFSFLINGGFDDVLDRNIDNQTWSELWADFLVEAKRFDQRQLHSIFGTNELVISEPELVNHEKQNGYDRKLIGEFIRRHHPRLAHEIAKKGFPGTTVLSFCESLSLKERNLIGLVARSHGNDLRKYSDHIERIFGAGSKLVPLGVHAIYHMVLLRIGDYIQIDRSRTSITLLKLRSLSSPISNVEHRSHLAIDSIDDKYQLDPERIYVTASPQNSAMFFKLKRLFSSIQHELDQSWAVLGELYGGHEGRPDIRFRRLRSNLEEESYQVSLPYVPQQFAFRANDDLIRLLISPLYGDDPSYGVRELLQNAVDACREMEQITDNSENYQPVVHLSITPEDEHYLFKITDNGIGMDINIIKNFFLNAGASFRNSQAWSKRFRDDKGESTVRKSGRFGVGALAAFLIGEEIEVSTKRYDEVEGFHFKATIDSQDIELVKDNSLPIGTTIKIVITKEIYDRFKPTQRAKSEGTKWFQWYTLNKPKICYHYGETSFGVSQPNPDITDTPTNWQTIFPENYSGLMWTYDLRANPAKFTCNGISIPQNPGTNGLTLGLLPHFPKISIFDNSGRLPLTLNRNGYSERFTFNEDLETDVSKDLIAFLLTIDIRSKISPQKISLIKQQLNYPGLPDKFTHDGFSYGMLSYSNNSAASMAKYPLLGKNGFLFDYAHCVNTVKQLRGLYLHTPENHVEIEGFDIGDYFIKFSAYSIKTIPDHKAILEPKNSSTTSCPAMIFLKKKDYEHLFEDGTRRLSVSFKNRAKKIFEKGDWIVLNLNLGRRPIVTGDLLKQYGDKIDLIREYDIKARAQGYKILNNLLDRYLGKDMIIPYNIEDRIKKFPLAFEELGRYMHKYK